MKQILTSKMLRKLLILSCLIIGLVFVTSSSNATTQVAAAANCYSDYDICAAICDIINGQQNCYTDCMFKYAMCENAAWTGTSGSGGPPYPPDSPNPSVTPNECHFTTLNAYDYCLSKLNGPFATPEDEAAAKVNAGACLLGIPTSQLEACTLLPLPVIY